MIGMQGRGKGRLTFVAEAAESSERPPGHGDAGGRWRRAIAPRPTSEVGICATTFLANARGGRGARVTRGQRRLRDTGRVLQKPIGSIDMQSNRVPPIKDQIAAHPH